MIGGYDWAGGREAMLRFGPDRGPIVIMAMPLFEEANRTRAFTVSLLRALGGLGIASALPDLPGTGESSTDLAQARLADWRTAFAAAAKSLGPPRTIHIAAIRGGALLTKSARGRSRWLFAPSDGAPLIRDLERAGMIRGAGNHDDRASDASKAETTLLAGNAIAAGMLRSLRSARIDQDAPVRAIRLDTDPAPADWHVPAAPLWRRAEPGNDAGLATMLAADLAAWVRACAA